MSELIDTLRAIVRDELARVRAPELGTVSRVYPKTSDDGPDNHQVNLELLESGLELQRVPVLVPRFGLSALPRQGDLMLVLFVGGALNAPVAVGCVYNADVHPPKAAQDEVVYLPPDDAQSGVRRLHIEVPSSASLTFEDDAFKIQAGDTQVVLNKDGDVVIASKGKLQLTADGDIEIEAKGSLKLSAQSDASLTAPSVKVEGQSDAKVQGAQLSLAGNVQFSPS